MMTAVQDLTIVPKAELDRLLAGSNLDPAQLSIFADICRLNALTAIKCAGSGHIGSSFSAMDIVVQLYLGVMNLRHVGVTSPDRDIYFSSKGHDAPGLYAVLYALGIVSLEKLTSLRRLGGLDGHPDVSIDGVEANTGSLGMGIAKARGIALAKKLKGHGGRVFVLLGDGELQEGQIWESALTAGNQGLGNVTVIVDRNGIQSDKSTEIISPLGDIAVKFASFGWDVETVDGHDHALLAAALGAASGSRPRLVIAETVKGRGVSFMEGQKRGPFDYVYRYHSGAPSDDDYGRAVGELCARIETAFGDSGLGALATERMQRPAPARPPVTESVVGAYGARLVELGAQVPELMVLVADLSDDCRTRAFEAAFSERFIDNGIAEQDMVSVAGGLALGGMLPVVNSFGCFLSTRPNEQIFNNFSEGTRIIYALHLSGVIPAGPGKSHQSVRDIGLLASLPGIEIIQPANPDAMRAALDYAVFEAPGTTVLRINAGPSPRRITFPADFRLTRGRGTVLRDGAQGVVLAYGPVMLDQALSAAERLSARGIEIAVIDMPWLNVVDAEWLAPYLREAPVLVVLDDHLSIGGLGDAVLRAVAQHGPAPRARIVLRGLEAIPACGQAGEVLRHHRLDAESIAELFAPAA
jgi:transketolase